MGAKIRNETYSLLVMSFLCVDILLKLCHCGVGTGYNDITEFTLKNSIDLGLDNCLIMKNLNLVLLLDADTSLAIC